MPFTSGGSCAFMGSWLSISISPLCVILVMGRLSASRCSFSIISIVCEMRTFPITAALNYCGVCLLIEFRNKNNITHSHVGSPFCAKRPAPLRPVPQGSFELGSQVIFHLLKLSYTVPEQLKQFTCNRIHFKTQLFKKRSHLVRG